MYSLERGAKQMLVELDEKMVSAVGKGQRNTIGWELNKVRDTSAEVGSIAWQSWYLKWILGDRKTWTCGNTAFEAEKLASRRPGGRKWWGFMGSAKKSGSVGAQVSERQRWKVMVEKLSGDKMGRPGWGSAREDYTAFWTWGCGIITLISEDNISIFHK